jgi:hypothetical protein
MMTVSIRRIGLLRGLLFASLLVFGTSAHAQGSFMPSCTAKREILLMRVTGTNGLTRFQPRVRLSRSGSRLPSRC